MHVILETPRLYLRQFTLEDAPLVQQLNSSAKVLQYLHEPPLESLEHAQQILTGIIFPQYPNGLGRWATFIKGSNEFIGWCGLKYRPELEEIDLGYRFLPTYWGKGYASEAALHTLHYGLQQLHLKTITGRADIENIGSIKVLEKIGMQFIKEEIVDNCQVKTFIATSQPDISLRPK